ncbi:unnamed protein product [Caenorhabditis brenneri]
MANVSKMEFPLLRLPILAIFEVLSTMNPLRIIDFSMLSSRCKKIVKLYFRPGCEFKVYLYFLDNPLITLKGTQNHYWQYEFTPEQKEDNTVKYDVEDNEDCKTLMKYSTDVIQSALSFFQYMDHLMNFKKLELLILEMCHFPSQNDLIIQEIKSIEKPIECFDLYSEEDVGNDVIDILSHVEGIKFLKLLVPFSEDFEMTVPSPLCYLYFNHGQWIKLNQLLEFDSSVIEFKNSKLTDLELCTFFQSWMSSESQLNLKILQLGIGNREVFENISRNLPHEETDVNVDRRIRTLPSRQTLLDWFLIKRNDGTIAIILLSCSNANPDFLSLRMVVG